MNRNIGPTDRIIRLILAVFLLCIAYWKASWILFAISLFVFFEAFYGWCILYQLIGKNSCPRK